MPEIFQGLDIIVESVYYAIEILATEFGIEYGLFFCKPHHYPAILGKKLIAGLVVQMDRPFAVKVIGLVNLYVDPQIDIGVDIGKIGDIGP
ncbi:hypothetical protein BOW57_09795 [Flavobacterium sp. YO64]|nr:hypothetical protein BOW57_09795 [Flavobacterium sp. YO64]